MYSYVGSDKNNSHYDFCESCVNISIFWNVTEMLAESGKVGENIVAVHVAVHVLNLSRSKC